MVATTRSTICPVRLAGGYRVARSMASHNFSSQANKQLIGKKMIHARTIDLRHAVKKKKIEGEEEKEKAKTCQTLQDQYLLFQNISLLPATNTTNDVRFTTVGTAANFQKCRCYVRIGVDVQFTTSS